MQTTSYASDKKNEPEKETDLFYSSLLRNTTKKIAEQIIAVDLLTSAFF